MNYIVHIEKLSLINLIWLIVSDILLERERERLIRHTTESKVKRDTGKREIHTFKNPPGKFVFPRGFFTPVGTLQHEIFQTLLYD